MANENRNMPPQPRSDREDDERMRGIGDDVRGIADDNEEDFEDTEDPDDEEEEEQDEGSF